MCASRMGGNAKHDAAVREVETAFSNYLKKTTQQYDTSKNVEVMHIFIGKCIVALFQKSSIDLVNLQWCLSFIKFHGNVFAGCFQPNL